MKSTIKIDTEQGQPILKIVQPIDCINFTLQNDDYDVRDKLLAEFIQKPSMSDWNGWFRVNTHFTHPFENPTHQITTIAPVMVDELFNLFKNNILNRLVPYNTIAAINSGNAKSQGKHAKITEFFSWLNEQEWATWEQQHPYLEEKGGTLTNRVGGAQDKAEEIAELRKALEQIVECTGTSTLQNKIAREALED